MPGFTKRHTKRDYGRAFPASRYNDPRGGRPSALERDILRYRAIEAALYLFYADEVRTFLLTDVYRAAVRQPGQSIWEQPEERRLQGVFAGLLREAESEKKIRQEDIDALRRAFEYERQQGKKLKTAFAFAITVGLFTEDEASELRDLLEYRNDIAHRIHLVMSDISRNYWTIDHLTYKAPTYKGDALERLRVYRRSLWERARGQLILTLSMDSMLFELAEHAFEQDLKRLDRIIAKQIRREEERVKAINAELDLRGTELVDDLAPRFPANHRPSRSYGDDYIPATGHLTKRGVEICYRLFDLGKSPIAVADNAARAPGHFGHYVGAEALDDLVERAGNRWQACELLDQPVTPSDRLAALDRLAVAIDGPGGEIALRIGEGLVELNREGMLKV